MNITNKCHISALNSHLNVHSDSANIETVACRLLISLFFASVKSSSYGWDTWNW